MRSARYPRYLARLAASGLRRYLVGIKEGRGQRAAVERQEIEWFLESLTDGSYAPAEDVALVDQLMSGTGERMLERNGGTIVRALEGADWVDLWVRKLVSGIRWSDAAWEARGGGWASEVTEQGWRDFRLNLAKAREELQEAMRLRPDRPEAPFTMMGLALGGDIGPGESVRYWFDRTVAARFDYRRAYSSLINATRRRWGGGDEALLAFGRECLATGRFDTIVPFVMQDVVDQIDEDQQAEDDVSTIYGDPTVIASLRDMSDGYLAAPKSALPPKVVASVAAVDEARAGNFHEAARRLAHAGGEVHAAERHRLSGEPAGHFAGRVAAASGPAASEVLRAIELTAAGPSRATAAEGAWETVLRKDPRAEVRGFVDDRRAVAALEGELGRGQPVRFLPRTPDLAGWRVTQGRSELEPDGALTARPGGKGHMIHSEARVGPDFEIAGRVEVVTPGTFQAGVLFGYPDFRTRDWYSFRLKNTPHEGRVAYFARHFESGAPSAAIAAGGSSTFRIQAWHGRLRAWVDGTLAIDDYVPGKNYVTAPDAKVGFGAYVEATEYAVRYRDVTLRRLVAAPSR
jgi:hypothetical protein